MHDSHQLFITYMWKSRIVLKLAQINMDSAFEMSSVRKKIPFRYIYIFLSGEYVQTSTFIYDSEKHFETLLQTSDNDQ